MDERDGVRGASTGRPHHADSAVAAAGGARGLCELGDSSRLSTPLRRRKSRRRTSLNLLDGCSQTRDGLPSSSSALTRTTSLCDFSLARKFSHFPARPRTRIVPRRRRRPQTAARRAKYRRRRFLPPHPPRAPNGTPPSPYRPKPDPTRRRISPLLRTVRYFLRRQRPRVARPRRRWGTSASGTIQLPFPPADSPRLQRKPLTLGSPQTPGAARAAATWPRALKEIVGGKHAFFQKLWHSSPLSSTPVESKAFTNENYKYVVDAIDSHL